jgi:endonuclease/exonuclease/phosphatase family metal-dependent hydrolase
MPMRHRLRANGKRAALGPEWPRLLEARAQRLPSGVTCQIPRYSSDRRTMRVLSWNVNGRVKEALRSQLQKLLGRSPDIVALQEVTRESYGAWCEGLTAQGYSVVSSVELLALPYPDPTIERRYMNLIAARHPLALLSGLSFDEPDPARIAFPEKYVVARVSVDGAAIDVHNAHLVPGSSRGIVKVHMFEAIRRRIEQPTASARILCGDFNTPRR